MNDEIEEMREELAIVSKAFFEQNDFLKSKEIKKLRIAVIILAILLFLSICGHIGWLIYENGMETVTETKMTYDILQENESGHNNYIGNDGDIIYGTAEN